MTALLTEHAASVSTAQHADDAFIILLTIEHDDLPAPIYLARNRQNVISRTRTYLAFPFNIELPTDGDRAPEARITMSNVDRRIGKALEAMVDPATVTIELILASDPDTVERSWGGLSFTTATWTAATVQLDISHIAYWDEPWPRKRVTPRKFPGLFP